MPGAGPTRLLLLCLCLGALAAGCKQKRIKVVGGVDKTGDYGRVALDAAVATFRKTPTSPEAYAALTREIERIRPAFNQGVSDLAERYLVFLALDPMAAQIDRPLDDQMNALGLTIWPTALHVEPEQGESLHAYLERACAGPLATDCRYVVPEAWPLVLGAIVWKRLKTRARESYSACTACASDRTYTELLEKYDHSETRMATQRSKADDLVERGAWPEAGEQAGPWSGEPVLDLAADPPTFAGEPIDGSWEKRVRGRPARGAVLGLRVLPRSEVRHVRAALRAAVQAGFRAVALQVRARAYPYPLREYRLTATRGAGAVEAHDVETAQILVRALDAAVAKSGQPPAASPMIQLVAEKN